MEIKTKLSAVPVALCIATWALAQGCVAPPQDCPANVQNQFHLANPQAKIIACEEERTGVHNDGHHERVTFAIAYKVPADEKIRHQTWNYGLKANGELELQSNSKNVYQIDEATFAASRVAGPEPIADKPTPDRDEHPSIAYRFSISKLDDFGKTTESTGQAWASGEMFRVQYGETEQSSFLVAEDAKKPTFMVHPASDTYYDFGAHEIPTLPLSRLQASRVEDDLEIELEEKPESRTVAGWPARQQVLRASFTIVTDYQTEVAKQRVSIELSVWVTHGFSGPEPPRNINPRRVGFSEIPDLFGTPSQQLQDIETKIADALAAAGGFPLEGHLELTRHFVGGEPTIEHKTVKLGGFERVEVPTSRFRVPAGYTDKPPSANILRQ